MAGLARAAFYRAAKAHEYQAAWDMLASARKARAADKHMYGVGLACAARAGRIGWVDALWRELRHNPDPPVQLNSHLSTAFISAFGSDPDRGRLRSSRAVLSWARDHGLANTTTYNAFLSAAARSLEPRRWGGEACAASETASMVDDALGEMSSRSVPYDSHTLSSAIAAYGRAGCLDRAVRIYKQHESLVDVFVTNALITAAARSGDAQLALETLAGMGPSASIVSYNATLQALAKTSQPLDRVAHALDIQRTMAAAGLVKDRSTLTSLLSIFGDSPLAEELVAGCDQELLRPPARGGGGEGDAGESGQGWEGRTEGESDPSRQKPSVPHPHDWGLRAGHGPASDGAMPDMAYATAQGKSRPAWQRQQRLSGGHGGGDGGGEGGGGDSSAGAVASNGAMEASQGGGTRVGGSDVLAGGFSSDDADLLGLQLQQTDLRGLTRPAAAIALRAALRRAAEASARGESVGGGWEIITRTPRRAVRRPNETEESLDALTASFLRASGVRYRRRARGVLVGADELEQAAASANVAARTQAVLQGSLLRIGIAVTTVAAVSLIPRLATML